MLRKAARNPRLSCNGGVQVFWVMLNLKMLSVSLAFNDQFVALDVTIMIYGDQTKYAKHIYFMCVGRATPSCNPLMGQINRNPYSMLWNL